MNYDDSRSLRAVDAFLFQSIQHLHVVFLVRKIWIITQCFFGLNLVLPRSIFQRITSIFQGVNLTGDMGSMIAFGSGRLAISRDLSFIGNRGIGARIRFRGCASRSFSLNCASLRNRPLWWTRWRVSVGSRVTWIRCHRYARWGSFPSNRGINKTWLVAHTQYLGCCLTRLFVYAMCVGGFLALSLLHAEFLGRGSSWFLMTQYYRRLSSRASKYIGLCCHRTEIQWRNSTQNSLLSECLEETEKWGSVVETKLCLIRNVAVTIM